MTIQWVAVSAARPGELQVLAHDKLWKKFLPPQRGFSDGGEVDPRPWPWAAWGVANREQRAPAP